MVKKLCSSKRCFSILYYKELILIFLKFRKKYVSCISYFIIVIIIIESVSIWCVISSMQVLEMPYTSLKTKFENTSS